MAQLNSNTGGREEGERANERAWCGIMERRRTGYNQPVTSVKLEVLSISPQA
jgi:hypothetical protein